MCNVDLTWTYMPVCIANICFHVCSHVHLRPQSSLPASPCTSFTHRPHYYRGAKANLPFIVIADSLIFLGRI